jgi:tRNA-specific 2-thiouridylase
MKGLLGVAYIILQIIMLRDSKKVLVGLSGGVDSAMAAWLLLKKGFEIQGLFLKMFPGKETCSSQKNAEKIAKQLKIELAIVDISDDFQQQVIAYFTREYQANRTPNPCVVCNAEVKFKWLLKQADKIGAEFVATGHYALIKKKALGIRKNFSY